MRHYLDYAATSAVRPEPVVAAIRTFLAEVGATPGRGGHALALDSGRIALRCRRAVGRVLGLPGDPGRIAFGLNATQALNAGLWGLLRPGDALVITAYDHNAVLRPAHHLSRVRDIDVRMLSGSPDGAVDLAELSRLLDGARLLVVNHVSNVLGTRLPLRAMAEEARDAGALVLVDTAQSAGHFPPALADEGADLVAFTGHKSLLGPQGIGGLWVRDGLELEPLLCGGTGGDSMLREMPPTYPDRLEAGTQNAPGMAGLLAGCEFRLDRGIEELHRREIELKLRLLDGLEEIRGVVVHSPRGDDGVGIVTVSARTTDAATLAARLEREWDVLVRAGLHCAPEVHRLLGTQESGAVRFSLGWASTTEDVDQAVRAMDAILRATTVSTRV